MNRDIARQHETRTGKRAEDGDTAVFSPNGRKQSMLETLMKQRENLVERKKSVAEQAEGQDLKSRLEEYDKQIAALDETIAQLQAQQEGETDEKQSAGIYEQPKTQQQIEAQRSGRLMDLAAADDRMSTLSGLRTQLIGRANVLDAALEGGYSADPAGKAQQSADLRGRAMRMESAVLDTARDVQETMGQMPAHDQPEQDDDQQRAAWPEA